MLRMVSLSDSLHDGFDEQVGDIDFAHRLDFSKKGIAIGFDEDRFSIIGDTDIDAGI